MATSETKSVRRTRTRTKAEPDDPSADQMLDTLVEQVGTLFEGVNATKENVDALGDRLDAVEKDLSARPTFTPAAISRASGKLMKMEIK